MEESRSQFLRSTTDRGTRISICRECLATVSDTTSEVEQETREQDHRCKVDPQQPFTSSRKSAVLSDG